MRRFVRLLVEFSFGREDEDEAEPEIATHAIGFALPGEPDDEERN